MTNPSWGIQPGTLNAYHGYAGTGKTQLMTTYQLQAIGRSVRTTGKTWAHFYFDSLRMLEYTSSSSTLRKFDNHPVLNIAAESEHPLVKQKLRDLEVAVRMAHFEELEEKTKELNAYGLNLQQQVKKIVDDNEQKNNRYTKTDVWREWQRDSHK